MNHYELLEQYHRPKDLDQALNILSKYENNAQIIAGGTDMLPVRQGDKRLCRTSHLIDVSKIGLNYIKKNKNNICIGAGTDINSIIKSPVFDSHPYKVLSQAAKEHSNYTLRNRATIGGNICNASVCSDLALPLLVLDADLVVKGKKGKRKIPIESFFKGPNYSDLKPGEILLEIVIPIKINKSSTSFLKLRRQQTKIDMAVVNVACLLCFEQDQCTNIRIALGSVGPIPFRAKLAETMLEKQIPDKEILRIAARTAAEQSSPISDIRATAQYRKEMVQVLVQNCLEECLLRS